MQKQAQTLRKRKSQIASAVEYVLCHIVKKERPGAILVFMTGWDDINSLKDQLQAHPLLGNLSKVLLLACHGSMASSEQPEDGVRKIVLATNMAETSITINDVVFVVDCGKAKETSYDALNNTPCLLPSWISKAAARQSPWQEICTAVKLRYSSLGEICFYRVYCPSVLSKVKGSFKAPSPCITWDVRRQKGSCPSEVAVFVIIPTMKTKVPLVMKVVLKTIIIPICPKTYADLSTIQRSNKNLWHTD
uniref:RNA helicase n=1 Tax=Fagus sylvatica TaxID=28930 RepID=A0A2N9FS29_FAGSY